MAMTPKLWSISAAAVELGKDRRTIAAALRDVAPDGQIDARTKGWRLEAIMAALRGDGAADAGGPDYAAEKARLTQAQADAQEMKNAMLRRELLARADVDAAVMGAFARVRARLIGLPAKAAPVVAASGSLTEVEALLRAAIDEALLELSGTDVADLCGDHGELVGDPEAAAEADDQPMGGSRAEAQP